MQKFECTNPNWQGIIEIFYNNKVLIKIDFTKAMVSKEVVTFFKANVPYNVADIANGIGNKTTIVEGTYEVLFEDFWQSYGKKINRKRCEPIWQKMSPAVRIAASTGIKKYKHYLKLEGFRNQLDPENYLKNETWKNEY